MAGPVPTYLSTQLAAQTAFNVPFGLIALVNTAITAATAGGEFNTTVDCSLFTAEDVSNLRIYLDSQGYLVEFAKNSSNKSLLIDWGRFLDIPGTEIVVDQGTSPWIVAGTVTANQGTSPWVVSGSIVTSPNVNIHDSAGNSLGSSGGSLNVDVTNTVPISGTVSVAGNVTVVQPTGSSLHVDVDNFPAIQPVSGTITANQGTSPWVTSVTNFPATVAVTQSTSPWIVSGTVVANAGTGTFLVDGSAHTQPISGTVIANQGTSPWVVSGSITTSPNVNVHDGSGVSISSTGSSLNVDVTNTVPVTGTFFQATQPVSGVGNFTVVQPTGTNLHTVVDNFPAVQPVSGTITANQGTSPWVTSVSNFPATVAVTQSTSPWVVSGAVTANIGTTGGLALDATLTNSTQKTQIVQGGNTAVVDATGDLQVDVNNFPASQNVVVTNTPTVNQGTSPWVVSGTVTANAGTGTFLVDGSAHTQPVSGTITANAGTGNFTVVQPSGAALHVDVDNLPALQSINIFSQSIPVATTESPSTKAIYSFGGGVTLAALATDVFQLRGSGTKTVRILALELFLTRTTVGSTIVTMIKRSTLDTGGTPLSFNVAPLDSNNANSSAIIDGFATNPTLGTAIGNVCTTNLLGEATGTVNQNGWRIDFQTPSLGQGCVLRGAAQAFVINFGGTTIAGGTLWYNIIWSEE